MDSQGLMHLSCPVCADDDCEGHPGSVTAIPGRKRRKMIVLDPGQVQATVNFLVFHCGFPPEGNHAARKAAGRDLVRRASRILLAREDDPLMRRVEGRTG